MIKFREKLYIAPLALLGGAANVAMVGSGVVGAVQGHNQAEEQERANEEQADLMRKQNKALLKLAEKNPQQAAQAQGVKQGMFSIMSNGVALAKDLGNAAMSKQGLKYLGGSIIGGAGFAATGYVGNKLIQGYEAVDNKKKQNSPQTQQTQYSSILSRKTFAFTPVKFNMENLKKGMSWAGKELKSGVTGWQGAAGVGLTVLPYAVSKISENKAAKNTIGGDGSVQQNYSALSGLATKITKPLTSVGSFGMGGYQKMQDFGQSLMKNSNSKWGKDIGKWITKKDAQGNLVNANKAAWASVVPGLAIGSKTMGIGEKIVETPMRKIDKGAYKYQDSQNEMVQN